MKRHLLLILLIAVSASAMAESAPNFYLIQYSPGENWNPAIPFSDQPGVAAHKAYLQKMYANDIIRMAGETAEGPGAIVLVRVSSHEQAQAVAEFDPAVINQILDVEVTGWRVYMSSMRHQRITQTPVVDPDLPFMIERLDPDAPITLKD